MEAYNKSDDLEPFFSKRTSLVQNGINKHRHRILHTRIILDAKRHLKQTILIFFQICQEGVFNIIVEFCKFELV